MNMWQIVKLKIVSFLNRIRINFYVEKTTRFYRIVIHENVKPIFKWLKIILTMISLLAAFYTFTNVFSSFIFGLFIWLLITFVEQTIFIYNSSITLPKFNMINELDKLIGVSFGIASKEGEDKIPVVGFVINDDVEYARKLHKSLLSLSQGDLIDQNGNVCFSVTLLKSNEYIFLWYPNIESESVINFHKKVESKRKETNLTDRHTRLIESEIIGKRFPISVGSYFYTFKENYKNGVPFIFQITNKDKFGEIKNIDGLDNFIFSNLKIKDKEDLTRKDMEYDYLKVMD